MSLSTFGLSGGTPFGALRRFRAGIATTRGRWSSAIATGERERAADLGALHAELTSAEASIIRAWSAHLPSPPADAPHP